MALLIAFEVHTFENGSWQIASMFDEKELALIEARRKEEGIRPRETRVVEEVFDEESGRTRSKIIYATPKVRSAESPALTEKPGPPQPQANIKPPAANRDGRARIRHPRPAPRQKPPNMLLVGLTFFLIVGFGVAALVVLRQLSLAG